MEGPDRKTSLEPIELRQLISAIRSGEYEKISLDELVLGSFEKLPNSEEILISKLVEKVSSLKQTFQKA